jgi:hypothetical protein
MTDSPAAADASGADHITQPELDRLALAVTDRFAPHLDAAAAAVREAEQDMAGAHGAITRAEQAAASARYVSNPLAFMRVTVREELEALERKTTPKKVRASYRYLLARAAELAQGEVAGYRRDLEAARLDREQGVAACRRAEQEALGGLEGARAMLQRVRDAERAAREGLAMLREKAQPDPL